MLRLIRQGRISKWFSGYGQEAIAVGCAWALRDDDYVLPMHRNLGVFTTRGVDLRRLCTPPLPPDTILNVNVPDLPFEESAELREVLEEKGLGVIQLVTPATPLQPLSAVVGGSAERSMNSVS